MLTTNDLGFALAEISDRDLVPDEYQNELISWREVFTTGYFRVGDIASDLCWRAAELGYKVPEVRIFEAIGRFLGRSARTIRYYQETAIFYPIEVRQEFEILPFSFFVFARSLGSRWREVLEYAASEPGITKEALMNRFLYERKEGDQGVIADETYHQDSGGGLPVSDGSKKGESGIVSPASPNPEYDRRILLSSLSDTICSVSKARDACWKDETLKSVKDHSIVDRIMDALDKISEGLQELSDLSRVIASGE